MELIVVENKRYYYGKLRTDYEIRYKATSLRELIIKLSDFDLWFAIYSTTNKKEVFRVKKLMEQGKWNTVKSEKVLEE